MIHIRLPGGLGCMRLGAVLVVCALFLISCGCSGITVHRVSAADLADLEQASVLAGGDLSERSLQTLHQLDLDQLYRRSPAQAHAQLRILATEDPRPDTLFVLAELSYLLGREAEKWDNPHACCFFYFSAGYAYHFLFSRDLAGSGPSSFDPRFRLACDLYNAGLAKCIRAVQRIGRLDPGRELHLPTPDGQGFTLAVVHHGFAWRPEEFGPLLFSADFSVEGLASRYHNYGLGVPLIGTRQASAQSPQHLFYPKDVNFPVTAFFRFTGSVADLETQRAGRLELYNPLTVQTVLINGQDVPLETDLTTPLAYFLSRTDLEEIGFKGFLRADKIEHRTGIYMFEPYQPGKIPVLMVHGLLSSPVTWAPLFNDLRADPVLRERFQFWFYLYPTANPYLVTAADLRQALSDLRAELDPRHEDASLDRMVLVGHSLGGLVSKLLTTSGGDDFWRLTSSEPFESLQLHADTRAELQRVFYFETEPWVRRVIFLGTPHHGSSLSPSPPARLLARFVRLPRSLLNVARDVAQENPQFWSSLRDGKVPTSLDMLAPGAPALELLAARFLPEGVHFHSIIGVLPHPNHLLESVLSAAASREGTDGVVPYSSAHLEGVDSELIVPADHFHVHHHPLAVQEVRRILMEHLQTVNQMDGP
jgi:pimeloyl-ACP methyl ester carboxylesterase